MTEHGKKPTILLIAIGGTISMMKDPQTGRSVPARTAADLLAQTPLAQGIEARLLDFTEKSESPAGLENLLLLARRIQHEIQRGLDGIVVTHGTDTLEEAAYFIDEVIPPTVPIVFTGAMRPGWATGYDGIRNLENALRVAQVVPAEYGVLVTMNDEIFEAWSVYKADSGALDAFAARRGAPFGRIFGDQVECAWRPVPRARLGKIPTALPTAVPILTMGVADEALLLDRLSDTPLQGVIIAGMAAGTIPPQARKRILSLAESGLAVVLCSSAMSGRTAEHYYYPQAYDDLTAAGIIIEDHLVPRKARLRLLLSLGLDVLYVPFGWEFAVRRW
ncbi:MAG: asparaginase [Candidatus Binatia bacterium]